MDLPKIKHTNSIAFLGGKKKAEIHYEVQNFIINKFTMPVGYQWSVLGALGIAAMIGQIYLTKAFSYQKTGVIAAIGYSNIVFSIIFGYILGDAFPSAMSLIGIVLIITCGVMVSWKPREIVD